MEGGSWGQQRLGGWGRQVLPKATFPFLLPGLGQYSRQALAEGQLPVDFSGASIVRGARNL